ncbi:ubiquitin-related domain-containing protein [Paraphoma chrysanthemicola]|uniref:Ubiquitin-related domain-containing protein n=1 Tax=Paraphoma chrysanthemicola TaxID=798071 RepID=A0A8K0RKC6_9PLEO|nr:ubiquitin-related domain-containing protein [Paraphoma chrysanthemicola]KAH7094946.1 ubiquitin-related domain-containing protein [Paraphoma chrysanthemicola]
MRRTSSISSISSSASEAEDTMQIFIKTVSGDSTIPLTIPSNTSISTLRTLLALRTNLSTPSDLRLVHAGKHLSSSTSTLSSYNILPNSTLHMALPLRGGMPPKKIRCSFKLCKDAAQRIVGDCGFCSGHYCGKHRLLEDHKCEGLEDCKKESHERNAERLNSERTVAIKGV